METIIETYVIILSKLTKCHEVDFDECEFGEYSKKLGEYFNSGKSQKKRFFAKKIVSNHICYICMRVAITWKELESNVCI